MPRVEETVQFVCMYYAPGSPHIFDNNRPVAHSLVPCCSILEFPWLELYQVYLGIKHSPSLVSSNLAIRHPVFKQARTSDSTWLTRQRNRSPRHHAFSMVDARHLAIDPFTPFSPGEEYCILTLDLR